MPVEAILHRYDGGMKPAILPLGTTCVLLLLNLTIASRSSADGIVDLTRLDDFAEQPLPDYITQDNTPADNPITDAGATLGRILFYDPRLSSDGTIACASCHQQSAAFGDPAQQSPGVNGLTGRHSMRLINARFAEETRFFWDERADSLEEQTTMPIQDHAEMGFSGEDGDPSLADLIDRLEAIEVYRILFTWVYGDANISEERMQDALAQFVRSIQSFDSAYDIGRAQVDDHGDPFPNYTVSENRGKALFSARPQFAPGGQRIGGGAGCMVCHRAPEFDIDPESRSNGVITAIAGGTDTTVTRSPTLRDLVDADGNPHSGFMHTADPDTQGDLFDVIAHYNDLPASGNAIDRRLTPGGQPQQLNLTQQEMADLVAFLETLTGSDVYTNPKWSNPFGESGEVQLIIPPGEITCEQVSATQLRLGATGIPGLDYTLQRSNDLLRWTDIASLFAQPDGSMEFVVSLSVGSEFYRIVYP